MKPITLILLLSLITNLSSAQSCDCPAALSFVIQKIEANYPGMKDKVTDKTRAAYQLHTDTLRTRAAKPQNQQQFRCGMVVLDYIRFFKDGHLGFGTVNAAQANINKDSIRAAFANWPAVKYSAEEFQNYLATNAKKLKPLEGVWQNEAGNYKVGIRYQDKKYIGFIIKADSIYWMPGQIKMELIPDKNVVNSRFYLYAHALQLYPVDMQDIDKGVFEIPNAGKWLKLDENGKFVYKDYHPYFGLVNFKRLGPKTNLITIKSFSETLRDVIDSIVTANHRAIISADNLIIDVRGNGGGSDIAYASLEQYLFTNPYNSIGAEVYCTNDNIQKFRELTTNPLFTPKEQEHFRERVKRMEAHLNQFWSSSPTYRNSDTLEVLARPKRIAIIIDSTCASTTEQFLLDPVLNSKKAIIFGTHSAGILDYANNYSFLVPGTNFRIHYPTSRSKRIDLGKGIDNVGIAPHVKLDANIKDWVNFAQYYLENNNSN